MKTITKTYKVYEFDELSQEAKDKAIEHFRELQQDDTYWHEFVFDDAKEVGKCIGIDIKNIYFNGFYSQGDGACFEGNYQYEKNSVKKLKDYAPEDKELHRIAECLYKLQRENFYKLTANVKHSGHYYHSRCTDIIIETSEGNGVNEKIENELAELLRDFMNWIYKMLRLEYESVNSDESIAETIKINDYQFL